MAGGPTEQIEQVHLFRVVHLMPTMPLRHSFKIALGAAIRRLGAGGGKIKSRFRRSQSLRLIPFSFWVTCLLMFLH